MLIELLNVLFKLVAVITVVITAIFFWPALLFVLLISNFGGKMDTVALFGAIVATFVSQLAWMLSAIIFLDKACVDSWC